MVLLSAFLNTGRRTRDDRRGKGEATLGAEDKTAGQRAYLASSSPINLSLYERHGFCSIGCVEVGSAPPIYPILRPARSL